MKITYLLNQRFPTEKAYGRQIAKMCFNFAKISDLILELVYPVRGNLKTDTIFDQYDIKNNFKMRGVWAPDFYWPGKLDVIAFLIKSLLSSFVLMRTALRSDSDIIYSRDELPLYLLSFFKRNFVFEAHKMQANRAFMYRRFKKINIKIITITHALKSDFINIGYEPKNILVAPDGVDAKVVEREESSPSDKKSARMVLDLPLDEKLIVYVGSLFHWKGIYILADAAKIAPDLSFVVVGGDSRGDEADFRKYLVDHDIKNVKVTGYIKPEKTLLNYFAAGDVFVLPRTATDKVSEKYTSPLTMFSYMAARRPIIASDLPSLREVLNDKNAFFVKPDDAQALAGGIKSVLGDHVLAAHISEQAFHDVRHYTWEKRAQNIIDFIS